MSRINKLEHIYKEPLKDHKIKDTSNFIQSILNADITKGKYARFLIESFLNDKFLEEDLIGELDSTVGQAISLFHKYKHKLPIEYRSVYAVNLETGEALYQSPGDLWKSVKQYQGELSGKELKREEQEQVYRETEFIYKDETTGFQIVSPLTEESAKWWGKGTRWCTSADHNNMFWDYAAYNPLLILLMPNGDKLQLWKDENNIQFMDEDDNKIKLEYIEQNWSILEPICLWLNNLKYIPDIYITEDICKNIIQQNRWALQYVPNKYITEEFYEIVVQNNGDALVGIPEEFRTKELCELAVKQNGEALFYVPYELRTKELCEMAVKQNGEALRYIPHEYKTPELCEMAVQNNGLALQFVPEYLKTSELCEPAVRSNKDALEYVPEKFRTRELCELAVKQNGSALRYIPYKYITQELCKNTVQKNGYTLKWVPKQYQTYELCELAVQQGGLALEYVPEDLKTKKVCETAVQQNGLSLCYVPMELRTKELCELAIQQNKHALQYVPMELRTKGHKDQIFEIPMEKYQDVFQEIKTLFTEKDMSLNIK